MHLAFSGLITFIYAFLETTWFLWWLAATVIVGWWSWRLIADDRIRPYEPPAHWRNLYRQALVELDETKVGIRINEAEAAILVELAAQVFTQDTTERTALHEAMNNLHRLRQSHDENSDQKRAA